MNWSMVNLLVSQHSLMDINYLEDYWPCADGLSAVNVIGTQVARPSKLGTDPMAYGGINK